MSGTRPQSAIFFFACAPILMLLLRRAAAPLLSAAARCAATSSSKNGRVERLRAALEKEKSGAQKPTLNPIVEEPNELEQQLPPDVEEAHRFALQQGEAMYTDPRSGLMVFTRLSHIDRGRCCGSHCRHCPYGHANVPPARLERWRAQRAAKAEAAPATSPAPACAPREVSKMSATVPPPPPLVTGGTSRVYTRTGDGGESSLFTGERRRKCDAVFDTLGTVDELNSHIGLALAHIRVQLRDATAPVTGEQRRLLKERQRVADLLGTTQDRLLNVGSIVATPPESPEAAKESGNVTIDGAEPRLWTAELEMAIDCMDLLLPRLTAFIRPGGSTSAAQLHVARSTCRRAERMLIALRVAAPLQREVFPDVLKFVNRLSDFLFTAARLMDE